MNPALATMHPFGSTLASLNSTMQMQLTRHLDPHRVGEYWASKIDTAIDKATQFDAGTNSDWCSHVHYQDLLAEPGKTLERIYSDFGVPMNDLHLDYRYQSSVYAGATAGEAVPGRDILKLPSYGYVQSATIWSEPARFGLDLNYQF